MAELHVQRKRNNYWWLWLLIVLIIIAAAIYWYMNYYHKMAIQFKMMDMQYLQPGYLMMLFMINP